MEAIDTAMAWTRLEDSPQWAAMTPQQRVWLAAFLVSASALAATRVAYKVSSEDNARLMAWETPKRETVAAALDIALPERDAQPRTRAEKIRDARRQLHHAKPGSIAATEALRQLSQLEQPEEQPKVESVPEPVKTVPVDAIEVWRDKKTGEVIGYRGVDGVAVKL